MSQKVCDFDVTLNCCILIQSNEHLDLIENEIMGAYTMRVLCNNRHVGQRLIGLDVEWPPMTGKWSSGESSLLQIGFRNKAYLFDLYALRVCFQYLRADCLLSCFYRNQNGLESF